MTRVIVHAGFHKTGTTSLQGFLERNKKALKPHIAIYQKQALKGVLHAGTRYGQLPVFWRRWMFRTKLRAFLNAIPDAPTIVISRETLSGMILGDRGHHLRIHRRYASMAIPLAQEIIRELQRRFGTNAEIEFLYTTREGESFLQSVWRHLVRTRRFKMEYPQFRAFFGDPPDLALEAAEIARAIAPVPVHIAPLETYGQDRFGPARALLDLLALPKEVEAKLQPAIRNNPGQSDDLSQVFLEMNRSKMRKRELAATKHDLAMAERPPETRRKPKQARQTR